MSLSLEIQFAYLIDMESWYIVTQRYISVTSERTMMKGYLMPEKTFMLRNLIPKLSLIHIFTMEDGKIVIDKDKCNNCARCVKSCPTDAWVGNCLLYTSTSITAAFAVSSLLVVIALVILFARNIVERKFKKKSQGSQRR